jgi:hypothetical protein
MSRARIGAALAAAAAIATVASAAPANAATSATATQTVTFTNQQSVQLNLSPGTYNFGTVDPLTTYSSPSGANTATVYSNGAWHLTVQGTGNFSDGGSPAKLIPDSRMTVAGNGGTPVTLGTTPGTVASGSQTPQAGDAVNLIYALTLQWGDPTSTSAFSDTLTYTAYTP